jgi:hypothetical protein
MKRTRVSWSDAVDQIEGPCVVCGKDVQYLMPVDRPDPALLFHSTCDVMPVLREKLKTATPPLMPEQNIVVKPKPVTPPSAAVPPAAAPTPTPPVA